MKIIIEDFKFEGKHYDMAEFEMPNVSNIEDIPEENIVDYVREGLENLLK